jgi:hypothetical protein
MGRRGNKTNMIRFAKILDRNIEAARRETAKLEQAAYYEYSNLSEENKAKYLILHPDGVLVKKLRREKDEEIRKLKEEIRKYKMLTREQKQAYRELYPKSEAFRIGDLEIKQETNKIVRNTGFVGFFKASFEIILALLFIPFYLAYAAFLYSILFMLIFCPPAWPLAILIYSLIDETVNKPIKNIFNNEN